MDDKVQRKIEEATEDLRPTWTKRLLSIPEEAAVTIADYIIYTCQRKTGKIYAAYGYKI